MLHLSVFDVFSKYFYCLSFGTSYWFNVIFRIIYLFFYLNRSIIKSMFIQSFVCSLLIIINFSILILFFYFEKTYLQNAFIFGTPTENPWPFHSLFIILIIYLIKIIFIFVWINYLNYLLVCDLQKIHFLLPWNMPRFPIFTHFFKIELLIHLDINCTS